MLFTPTPRARGAARTPLFSPASTVQSAPRSTPQPMVLAEPAMLAPTRPLFAPVPMQAAPPLFASSAALVGREQPAEPPAAEPAPDVVMPHQFVLALAEHIGRRARAEGEAAADGVAEQLPLLARYAEMCELELERLKARPVGQGAAASAERTLLENERNTWLLLLTLYRDYDARQQQPPDFPSQPEPWGENLRALGPPPPRVNGGSAELAAAGDGPLSSTSANAGLAPRSLHDEAVQEGIILAADPLLDVGMRAVRWFEDIASEEAGAPLPQDASSRATAVALKSRGAAAAAADGLPSSIDPDAPSYERAALAPSDDDEASYLMRTLWRLIRAGRVSDAADFCRQCRQWWRAASLGGGSPFRYDPTSATWTGNPDRPLWRRACMVIARRANRRAGVESAAAVAAAHEAAVYAALGGGEEAIPLVLGACDGWKDEVWANLKLGLATAMSARAQLVCDGRTPQQLQLNALRSVFERAAGAPGDADAARAHFAMQAGLVLLRCAQLPEGDAAGADAGRTRAEEAVAQLRGVLSLGMNMRFGAPDADGSTTAQRALGCAARAEPLGAPGDGSDAGAGSDITCRLRAHVLRFAAHASLFLCALPLPAAAAASATAAPAFAEWQGLLRAYVRHVAEVAAHAPRGVDVDGEVSDDGPPLSEGASAVALLARELSTEVAVIEGYAHYLARLPPSLPLEAMGAAFGAAAERLHAHLLPHIALRAALDRLASPAPTPSTPLDPLRWLILSPSEAPLHPWQLHHALAHGLATLRRTLSAADFDLSALLPPPPKPSGSARTNTAAAALGGAVLVHGGIFEALEQNESGAVLLMRREASAGEAAGGWQAYGARPLERGVPARMAGTWALPARIRADLIADEEGLCFRVEDAEVLPSADPSARAAAQSAASSVEVTYKLPPPPTIEFLEDLQRCCAHAQAAADTPLPFKELHAELSFWWHALKATAAQRQWAMCMGARPHAGQHEFASRVMRQGAADAGIAEWSAVLQRRAHACASLLEGALRIEEKTMGALPSAADVDATWTGPHAPPGAAIGAAIGADSRPSPPADDARWRGASGLVELRTAVIPSLVTSLHHVLVETGRAAGESSWLHLSFEVADLLADERLRLYSHFDAKGLKAMLLRFRASGLEILAADGA